MGLSTSEIRVRPGEGSLPLGCPAGHPWKQKLLLLGLQAWTSPGRGRVEKWSSQPEGPVKLKVSRTDRGHPRFLWSAWVSPGRALW